MQAHSQTHTHKHTYKHTHKHTHKHKHTYKYTRKHVLTLLPPPPTSTNPLRIDTFVHSGIGLGGPKYPKKTVLPGVISLMQELQARIAFVTARPKFVERLTFRSLKDFGIQASVLCGHLSDSLLIPFAPNFCNSRISLTKVSNAVRYSFLFPECRFVWFGDSGQGDVLTAQELLKAQAESGGCDSGGDGDGDGDGDDNATGASRSASQSPSTGRTRSKTAPGVAPASTTPTTSHPRAAQEMTPGGGRTPQHLSPSASPTAVRRAEQQHQQEQRRQSSMLEYLASSKQLQTLKKKSGGKKGGENKSMMRGQVVAAYIQDVVKDDGISFKTSPEERQQLAAQGIHVVNNYIEVALHMHQVHGLISADQLRKVTRDAVMDLKAVDKAFRHDRVKLARYTEHREQVERVNKVLRQHALPELVFDMIRPDAEKHLRRLETILRDFDSSSSA